MCFTCLNSALHLIGLNVSAYVFVLYFTVYNSPWNFFDKEFMNGYVTNI